jgi:hypothetical protein
MEWKMENGKRQRSRRLLLPASICLLPFAICHLSGCGPTPPPSTQPTSLSQRQDAALKDPMGYKPYVGEDVSGGDLGNFDKAGFKRDLDDVLNP